MTRRLSAVLRRGMRHRSTAATPPSASLPAGLPGGRIRSWIHASLVVVLARKVASSHVYEPLVPARTLTWLQAVGASAVEYFAESDLLRPSSAPINLARGTPARKVRRLEDASILPSFAAKKQAQKLFFAIAFRRSLFARIIAPEAALAKSEQRPSSLPQHLPGDEQHVRGALRQSPHEVRIPLRAKGNIHPKPITFAYQLLLQVAAHAVQHLEFVR